MKRLFGFQAVSVLSVFGLAVLLLAGLIMKLPIGWALHTLWRYNWLSLVEALAIFSVLPLAFVALVALDRRVHVHNEREPNR